MISPPPAKSLTDAQLADEFAETRLRMMAWKPALNPDAQRYSELSDELLARQADEPAEKRILIEGEKFVVPISPQENSSTITDVGAVYRVIRRKGNDILLGAYSITLAKARKLLSDQQQQKWITTERTGAREIGEPVWKGQAAA